MCEPFVFTAPVCGDYRRSGHVSSSRAGGRETEAMNSPSVPLARLTSIPFHPTRKCARWPPFQTAPLDAVCFRIKRTNFNVAKRRKIHRPVRRIVADPHGVRGGSPTSSSGIRGMSHSRAPLFQIASSGVFLL